MAELGGGGWRCAGRLIAGFLEFHGAQGLAVRAVTADFGSGEHNLEAEVRFNLTPQPLQRFSEELLDPAAAEADYVRMFLFRARLVIMLIAAVMHEVEFVH